VIDAAETQLGKLRIRAGAAQAERLVEWAAAWPERTWAVEGAGGLGHLLAQQLVAAGEKVLDIQPKLGARVRLLSAGRSGKSDPNDARSVAIAIAAQRSPVRRAVVADDHARSCSVPCGPGLILLGHAGWDAATVADRDAVGLRPGADVCAVLPANRAPAGPAGQPPASLAGVLNERRELLAEAAGVLGAQIDLIIGTVDPEPNRLIRSTGRPAPAWRAFAGRGRTGRRAAREPRPPGAGSCGRSRGRTG
jgi:hypothetical protein